jgi:hypothetical protein
MIWYNSSAEQGTIPICVCVCCSCGIFFLGWVLIVTVYILVMFTPVVFFGGLRLLQLINSGSQQILLNQTCARFIEYFSFSELMENHI